jgi:hypothetical protein
MKVGDVVKPKDPAGNPLRSGGSWYPVAVVVRMDPFALVSEESDMLWCAMVKPEHYEVCGTASPEVLENCMRRIEDDNV